jgi:hypothetical protein
MERASRESWQNGPMPETCGELGYTAEFTPAEFRTLSLGVVPQEMEDMWFVFLDGDTLYLHRSWTGACIYQLTFAEIDGRHVVRRALVNRDPDQYRETDSSYDSKLLGFLIEGFLLGRSVPFPVPRGFEEPKGLYQHSVIGRAYPEESVDRSPDGSDS